MDKEKIKRLAVELEDIANKYSSTDPDVKKLSHSLGSLIDKAKAGLITDAVDHVPGEYWFQEGDLAKYPDLEAAYSKFKLAITLKDEQYEDLKAWAEKRRKDLFGER